MTLIRHCIVDTNTNKVINVVEYESVQNGIPPGFEKQHPNWLCVQSDTANINDDYINKNFIDNRPKPKFDFGQ